MPTKPRPKKGHRFIDTPKLRLGQRTREELLYTAGEPRGRAAAELIREVEETLAEAVRLRHDADRGPTDAGRAALLHEVEKAARALERALLDLDQSSLMELDTKFIDHHNEVLLLDDIVYLYEDAKEERARLLKSSRRGRAKEETRDYAIKSLAGAFHQHADPSINGEYRIALLEFVGIALRAAKFSAPGLGPRKATTSVKDLTEGRKTWRLIDDACRKPRQVG
jgi:hypothetical protein